MQKKREKEKEKRAYDFPSVLFRLFGFFDSHLLLERCAVCIHPTKSISIITIRHDEYRPSSTMRNRGLMRKKRKEEHTFISVSGDKVLLWRRMTVTAVRSGARWSSVGRAGVVVITLRCHVVC